MDISSTRSSFYRIVKKSDPNQNAYRFEKSCAKLMSVSFDALGYLAQLGEWVVGDERRPQVENQTGAALVCMISR